jgi:PTH1 family peptidyl-tRNA hydrolase
MKLIVGLGNPGLRYEGNRHNAGFMALDALGKVLDVSVNKKQARALIGQGVYLTHRLLLAKPQTYMNLSGESVMELLHYYRDRIEDLIVIHDDMDIPLGRLRFKASGGSGGHNGLKSVTRMLGSQTYDRLKIGIGRPAAFMKPEAYVLSDFTAPEAGILEETMDTAAEALKCWITSDCQTAMNRFN